MGSPETWHIQDRLVNYHLSTCKSQLGQGHVTGGERYLCWLAASVTNIQWKPLRIWKIIKVEVRNSFQFGNWATS